MNDNAPSGLVGVKNNGLDGYTDYYENSAGILTEIDFDGFGELEFFTQYNENGSELSSIYDYTGDSADFVTAMLADSDALTQLANNDINESVMYADLVINGSDLTDADRQYDADMANYYTYLAQQAQARATSDMAWAGTVAGGGTPPTPQ